MEQAQLSKAQTNVSKERLYRVCYLLDAVVNMRCEDNDLLSIYEELLNSGELEASPIYYIYWALVHASCKPEAMMLSSYIENTKPKLTNSVLLMRKIIIMMDQELSDDEFKKFVQSIPRDDRGSLDNFMSGVEKRMNLYRCLENKTLISPENLTLLTNSLEIIGHQKLKQYVEKSFLELQEFSSVSSTTPTPRLLPRNPPNTANADAGHAVKRFGRRLSKDVYSIRPDIPSNDWLWPRLSGTRFVTLALITNQSVTRDDAFTHRSLRNSEDDIPRYKMEIAYNEVFPKVLSDSRFKILVSGRPGIGKTVLLSKVCKDWANEECLSNVVALIHVPLRELHGKCARPTLADILEMYCADQSTIHDLSRSIEHIGGEGICFALDGLDEYPNLYSPSDLITDLITSRILPQASVIVTSRPVASEKVKESMTHVEIIGFMPRQIEEYITDYYKSQQHLAKKLLAYIDTHPNVKDMCYLPLHLAMIVFLNKVSRSQNLPETESEIYHRFVSHSVIRYVVKEKRDEDDDVYIEKFSDMKKFLSDEEYELFQNILCLALYAKIQSRIIFSVQDIENHFPTKFTHEQLKNLKKNGLGIISSYRMYSDFGQQRFFSFQHLTFQEFLGAYHLSTLDVDDQKMMLERHGNNPSMREVWKFFFGIIKSTDSVPLLYDKLAQLNPAKGVETLFLCRCAFETQGEDCSQELCCQLLSSRECQKMDISNVVLSSPDCSAIGFVLYNSPLEVKQLLMNYCQVGVEGIEALKAQLSKCPIEFEKISNFQIRSQLNPLGEKGATALKNILSKMPNLLELRLYGNQLTSEKLAIIEPVICSMRELRVLVLTKNNLGPATGKILCSLTMNFPNLIQFYVSYNPIGTKGFEDALPGLLKCTELKRLGLRDCNLDKNAGRLLSTIVFKLRNLEQLELYCNHLGDEGIIAMCDSLIQASKLEQFSVTKNDMGDKGGSQLAEVVKKSCSLKQIRLYYNDVTYITRQAFYIATREREQKGLESINYAI